MNALAPGESGAVVAGIVVGAGSELVGPGCVASGASGNLESIGTVDDSSLPDGATTCVESLRSNSATAAPAINTAETTAAIACRRRRPRRMITCAAETTDSASETCTSSTARRVRRS
jgi:hypothetical protein